MAVSLQRYYFLTPCLIVLCYVALCLAPGCTWTRRMNADAYREYHASRMLYAAQVLLTRDASLPWPAAPPAPLVCRERTERSYRQLVRAATASHSAWETQLAQSLLTVDLIERLVAALVGRDVPRIERLAPELLEHQDRLHALAMRSADCQAELDAVLQQLEAAWRQIWPECDMQFALAPYQAQVAPSLGGSVRGADRAALQHYYDSEYVRLAMTYLGYTPPEEPDPEPTIPEGTELLRVALTQMEAALRARYNLDQAVELDAAMLDEIAQAGLLDDNWRSAEVDPVAIGKERAGATLARLKLLRLADAVLGDCQQVLQTELTWQWRRACPDWEAETDIAAYAHIAVEASPATAARNVSSQP